MPPCAAAKTYTRPELFLRALAPVDATLAERGRGGSKTIPDRSSGHATSHGARVNVRDDTDNGGESDCNQMNATGSAIAT